MPRLFHHLGYTNSHTPRFIPEPYQCILEPQMPRHHQGKYKRQSEYEENLNYIIDHISSTQKFPDGFTHTSRGEAPNFVTIVFQCRGDSYGSKCRSCYATPISGIRRRCQGYKGAIIW
ncbi:unnamed protein product [Arabidopsis thaliana]|nr:unnamed protein product [Arabidopsis thaliana]